MDSQKRLWLALALSFGMTVVYVLWFMPKPPPPSAGASTPVAAPLPPPPEPPAAALPPAVHPSPHSVAPAQPLRRIERDQGSLKLVLTSAGAGLTKAELQGPKMHEQLPNLSWDEGLRTLTGRRLPDGPPVDMAVPVAGEPPALAISVEGASALPADAPYRVEELEGGAVRFTARQGPIEVVKTFEWSVQGFEFAMAVEVRNVGATAVAGQLAVHYGRGVEPGSEVKPSFIGGVGNLSLATCSTGEDLHKLVPDGKPPPEFSGPLNFFGVNQQYFLAAIFPLDGPKPARCVLNASAAGRSATAFFPLALAPGQTSLHRFGAYIGPKDIELLRTVPERMKPLGFSAVAAETSWSLNGSSFPHLERSIDFGWWAFICKILLAILKFFHSLIGNWGVAIILLTVVVKLALLPLTHKSMVSAEAMKKLQPKMEEIRRKFAEDRERQNLEMMKLYQEAKVNPLGGCFPMLVQMPVWIALYTTLRNSYEIYREPFIAPLWADLTYRDPTYLLPVALGVTQIITQRLQPQMMDAAQARIMTYVMPVFFTLIMINYPAGLSLYIFTNNLLTLVQQYGLRRYLEKKGVAAPRPSGQKTDKKVQRGLHERQSSRKRSAP